MYACIYVYTLGFPKKENNINNKDIHCKTLSIKDKF